MAWYDSGFVYHSPEWTWEELPEDGMQFLLVYHMPVTRTLYGDDFYFRAEGPDGHIFGSNRDDPEETRKRYKNAIIKRGRWMAQKAFDELVNAAITYCGKLDGR